MKTSAHGTASLLDVKQLLDFQIYNVNSMEDHETIAVFANKLQRCWIVVQFIAADEKGNPIDLTDAEMEQALSLVRYIDGKPLPSSYAFTFENNRFDWTESDIPGRHLKAGDASRNVGATSSRPYRESHPDATQTKTIYLSVAPGGKNETVGACFKVNESLIFWTGRPASADQARDGEFDSSVDVVAVPSPSASEIDFGAGTNGVLFDTPVGEQTRYTYRASEYYLNPKLNGKALPLDGIQGAPFAGGEPTTDVFGVYTHGKFDSPVQWGLSYYASPSNGELVSASLPKAPLSLVGGTAPDLMYKNCAGKIWGGLANAVVIGILKGKNAAVFTDSNGTKVADVQSTTVYIQDRYGNSYAKSLSYNAITDEVTFR